MVNRKSSKGREMETRPGWTRKVPSSYEEPAKSRMAIAKRAAQRSDDEVLDQHIKQIVVEEVSDRQALHDDIVDSVRQAITTELVAGGLEDEDRKDLREDLRHLRYWRRCIEQTQTFIAKAAITGAAGVVWLGIKAVIGK
jgi:hypothetical protein